MINISHIEKFATHDGPGIRTTVFLKGCSLHCPWCANPETWQIASVVMHDEQKCSRCHQCARTCPHHAITLKEDGWHCDRHACQGCGACVHACFNDALSLNGRWMSADDVIQDVLKDWDYYEESHGGVTFSGGEPFVQFAGFLELLKEAKRHHLHVACETTGNYPLTKLKEAAPYIDLFLFDLKHLDHRAYREVTGGNFKTIAANLAYLTSFRPQDVIIRIPVIPDFNEAVLHDMIDYAKAHHVAEVHLLPYHNLGKNKWHQLHRAYRYEEMAMMSHDHLKSYENDFVHIGG